MHFWMPLLRIGSLVVGLSVRGWRRIRLTASMGVTR